MTIFWILAAGLAGLATLFVVAPLLQSSAASDADDDIDLDRLNLALFKQQLAELDADLAAGKLAQDQYDSARQDLEREALHNVKAEDSSAATANTRLPSARLTALSLLVVVPLSAFALYLALGSQDMIPQLESAALGQPRASGHAGAEDGLPPLDVLVEKLEQRMQQNPQDAEGWIMLGRTYFAMRDTEKAENALERAYALMPEDTQVILAYAEALAANAGNTLEGRPAELIAEALKLDPSDPTARWLSGMAAFQRGQFSAASVAWKQSLAQLDPNSEEAAELRGLIAEAEQRAGVPSEARVADASGPQANTAVDAKIDAGGGDAGGDGSAGADAAVAAAQTGAAEQGPPEPVAAGIEVEVSLAPELAQEAGPETTVFVYAKAAAGPPMPLAVQRISVGDLPTTLHLDDAMAMMPAMQLSNFPQVIVGARVSATGQAMAQPGDLEGETGPVASSGAGTVAVQINRVRP
jgi:cytochrome c-type biogenesis protein CcmH